MYSYTHTHMRTHTQTQRCSLFTQTHILRESLKLGTTEAVKADDALKMLEQLHVLYRIGQDVRLYASAAFLVLYLHAYIIHILIDVTFFL